MTCAAMLSASYAAGRGAERNGSAYFELLLAKDGSLEAVNDHGYTHA